MLVLSISMPVLNVYYIIIIINWLLLIYIIYKYTIQRVKLGLYKLRIIKLLVHRFAALAGTVLKHLFKPLVW
jgi:hypothetical protein